MKRNSIVDTLTGKIGGIKSSLGDYHFLANRDRYNTCKLAATKLAFTHVNLNLLQLDACQKLAAILKLHNATLSLCNFTNISDYDFNQDLQYTIPALLQDSPDCFLMYSYDKIYLGTNISKNLADYFGKKQTHPSFEFVAQECDFDFDDACFVLSPNWKGI